MESGYRREQKGFQRKGKTMKEDSIVHKIKWCVDEHPRQHARCGPRTLLTRSRPQSPSLAGIA